MAFFWRRRATSDADDSGAEPAAVAWVLEWLPGLNTPLMWESPAEHADAHTATGNEDDLVIAHRLVGSELPAP